MKNRIYLFILILIILISFVWLQANNSKENLILENRNALTEISVQTYFGSDYGSEYIQKTDSLNLLEEVLIINGTDVSKPPTSFRKGHANPSNYKSKVEMTENGFVVKLEASNITPTPSAYDGAIFVSGGFGSKSYFSYDAKSGQCNWGSNLDDDGPSTAAIEEDIAVFNTESCTIFALDTKSGEEIWSYWLGDPLMSTPTVANGYVFTAYPTRPKEIKGKEAKEAAKKYDPSHALICFELKSGKIMWQQWLDSDIMTAPVAYENELYLTTFAGTYLKLDQKTGEINEALAIRATSAPTIVDDNMIVSARSDKDGEKASESYFDYAQKSKRFRKFNKKKALYLSAEVQEKSEYKSFAAAADAGNGFTAGAPATANTSYAQENIGYSNVSALQSHVGSRVLNKGNMNFAMRGDTIECTSKDSGDVNWSIGISGDLEKEGGNLATAPILVDDKIIIADLNGRIIVIDHETGSIEKTYQTEFSFRTQPIAYQGWIYATTTTGQLIGINTKDESIDGWPTLAKNNSRDNIGVQ